MFQKTPFIAAVILLSFSCAGSSRAQMEHVLFITSLSYSINPSAINGPIGNSFGSVIAADQICNFRGTSAFMVGKYGPQTYKALLSGPTNARDQVSIAGRIVNVQDELLATDFNDLWDGTIATSIRYNEFGSAIPNNTIFWTGSNQFGFVSQTAQNWQQTNPESVNTGFVQSTVNWLNQTLQPASGSFRLPCLCEARVIDPGDFNDDGLVDAADYIVWRKTLDSAVDRGVGADGDGDGVVTAADLDVWRQHFGKSYLAGSGANAVPEPASWAIAFFTVPAYAAMRRRQRSYPACGQCGGRLRSRERWPDCRS